MKGQWALLLALIFALIIAIFSVINVDSVSVNYLFGESQWPLILVIIGSVLLGALFVGSIGFVKFYRLQRSFKRAENELKTYREQDNELKSKIDQSQPTIKK